MTFTEKDAAKVAGLLADFEATTSAEQDAAAQTDSAIAALRLHEMGPGELGDRVAMILDQCDIAPEVSAIPDMVAKHDGPFGPPVGGTPPMVLAYRAGWDSAKTFPWEPADEVAGGTTHYPPGMMPFPV